MKEYHNPDDPGEHHALAMLTVRLVFLLYAEDAGLFARDAFGAYVRSYPADHLRAAMIALFEVLDTPYNERDAYLDADLNAFLYVNGGLFQEKIVIPQFNEDIKDALLHAGEGFDWRGISPVIFGSLMEETLSHDQRRAGGMHYTTVENIHRLIDPLFLDGLEAELSGYENDASLGERARANRLRAFQDKLASLRFLEPSVTLTGETTACENYGREIQQIAKQKKKRFCCDKCRNEWWNSHLDQVKRKAVYDFRCPHCGKEFHIYGDSRRKYCSHECYIADRFKGGGGDE